MGSLFPSQTNADLEMENILQRAEVDNAPSSTQVTETSDVYVYNGWGLVLNNELQIPPDFMLVGWSYGHIEAARKAFLEQAVQKSLGGVRDQQGLTAMLTFPGGYTFGHWLIEISARIQIVKDNFGLGAITFITPGPLSPWMIDILSAHGIGEGQCLSLCDGDIVKVQRLLMPALGHNSGFLPDYPFKESLKRLRSIGAGGSKRSLGPLLLVKHTPLTSHGQRSRLEYSEELLETLHELGFQDYDPLQDELREQARVFAEAQIIVGEDSSALHGFVFSHQAHLIVLGSVDRRNILHASLARVTEQSVTYVEAIPSEKTQTFNVATSDVMRVVEQAIARRAIEIN